MLLLKIRENNLSLTFKRLNGFFPIVGLALNRSNLPFVSINNAIKNPKC
jgi:hypothetical protein